MRRTACTAGAVGPPACLSHHLCSFFVVLLVACHPCNAGCFFNAAPVPCFCCQDCSDRSPRAQRLDELREVLTSDVKDVKEGLECGIGVSGMKKYLEGDVIEVFEVKEVKRTLD